MISVGPNLKNFYSSDLGTEIRYKCRSGGVVSSVGGSERCRSEHGRCSPRVHGSWGRVFFAFAFVFVFAFCWLVQVAPVAFASSPVPTIAAAQTVAGDALGGHQYPWYDPEARAVKPLKPKAGAGPFSKERKKVPMVKPKPAAATPTNTPTTGGGGGGGFGGGPVLPPNLFAWLNSTLVGILIIVGIVGLVFTFLRIEAFRSGENLDEGRSRQESIEQLPFELADSDGDFQSAAEKAYRSDDLRLAIVFLYSHVLVTLDQNRIIRLRKGKTNRQYLGEVRSRRGIASYFRQVMLPFESVFFGDHDMDADEFEKCWDGLNQFHANIKSDSGVLIG